MLWPGPASADDAPSAPSGEVIVVDEATSGGQRAPLLIGRYLDLLTDAKGDFTIEDVVGGRHDGEFIRSGSSRPQIPLSRAAHWARFTIDNVSPQRAFRILAIDHPNQHDVTFYLPGSDGQYRARASSARQGRRDSDLSGPLLFYRLVLPPNSRTKYYQRIQSPSARFSLRLSTPGDFATQTRIDSIIHGSLIGILLVTWVYLLILLAVTRDKGYAPLLYFVTAAAIYDFTRLGYHHSVFGEAGGYLSLASLFIQCLFGAVAINFFRTSTKAAETSALADKVLFFAIWSLLLTGLLSLFDFYTAVLLARLQFAVVILFILLSVARIVFVLKAQHLYVNLLAWSPMLIALTYSIMNSSGVVGRGAADPLVNSVGLSLTVICFLFVSVHAFAKQRHERASDAARAAQLVDLLSVSPIGVVISETFGGEILYTNPQADTMLRPGGGTLCGEAGSSIFADSQIEAGLAKDFRQSGECKDIEVELIDAENRRFWNLLTVQHIQFAGQSRVISWIYDVDQRKKFETILSLRERDFRNLAENSIQGVLIAAENRKPLFANQKLAQIFGYESPAEIIALPSTSLLAAPHEIPRIDQIRRQIYEDETQGGVTYEIEGVKKDGSLIWIEVSSGATWWNGERANHLAIIDITWRKQAEAEIVKARDTAEAASAAKTTFLATLSHEIRTPMNGILGMARLLISSKLSAHQRNLAETLLAAGSALGSFLDDVLDLSKLEASAFQVEEIAFDLRQIVTEVTELMRSRATEKGLSLAVRLEDDVPGKLVGDPTRIRQVLYNLVGNGIKFTDQGRIDVIVQYARDEEDGRLIVEVKDTGVGVPDDVRERMFEDFVQGDATVSRRFRGTGLGLAITKRLVERMQGHITHHDRAGGGTVFMIILPLAPPAAAPLQARRLAQPELLVRPLRILVAEDDDPSAMVITGYLDLLGHSATVVETGADAAKLVDREAFDFVLMDLQMPDMNGVEATKLIRALPDPKRSGVPILALTADITQVAQEAALAAGVNGVLHKPLTPERLALALQSFLPSSAYSADPSPAALGRPGQRIFDHEVIARMITDLGYDRVEALLGKARTSYLDMTIALRGLLQETEMDRQAIAKIAHKMTGTTSSAGLFVLSDTIRDLENKAVSGESSEAVAELFDQIDVLAVHSFTAMSEFLNDASNFAAGPLSDSLRK